MMHLSRLPLVLTASALFSTAIASLQVTNPGKDLWWVAKSENVLAWTCESSQVDTFTVLVANKLHIQSPFAIIAIVNNADCSREITPDQTSNLPPLLGYTIQLANPLNSSEIYTTSEEFEIKPFGSPSPVAEHI